jgi:hypothetical protein
MNTEMISSVFIVSFERHYYFNLSPEPPSRRRKSPKKQLICGKGVKFKGAV